MFLATGRHLKDLPMSIGREDFNNGYSLFVFNLTPSDDSNRLKRKSRAGVEISNAHAAHHDAYHLRLLQFYSGDQRQETGSGGLLLKDGHRSTREPSAVSGHISEQSIKGFHVTSPITSKHWC